LSFGFLSVNLNKDTRLMAFFRTAWVSWHQKG